MMDLRFHFTGTKRTKPGKQTEGTLKYMDMEVSTYIWPCSVFFCFCSLVLFLLFIRTIMLKSMNYCSFSPSDFPGGGEL